MFIFIHLRYPLISCPIRLYLINLSLKCENLREDSLKIQELFLTCLKRYEGLDGPGSSESL